MDKALYVNGDEKIEINAYDITPSQYQEKYKGKLYCTQDGCSAQLVHMEMQKRGDIKCFRTLQNSKHIEGCPYEVVKSGKIRRLGKDGEVINVELTERHVRDILNDTYKKATGQDKDKASKNGNARRKKAPQDKVVAGEKDKENVVSGQVRAVPGGSISDGTKREKQPFVYKKSISEMLKNSKNDTYSLYGIVKQIDIDKDEAFMTIVDEDEVDMKVYFGNPFRDNHPQEFKYLKFFKLYLEECKKKKQNIICVAICFRRELKGEVVGEVMDYHNIQLDKKGLYGIRNMLIQNGYKYI